MQKKAKNLKEMKEVAALVANRIAGFKKNKKALVVGLSGELGAGKTTLVKYIAKHFGVRDRLSSPTFVILKRYKLRPGSNFGFFFHVDAYRLKNEEELEKLGWSEIINDPENIIFIEWPENVAKVIPNKSKCIYIQHQPEGRSVKMV